MAEPRPPRVEAGSPERGPLVERREIETPGMDPSDVVEPAEPPASRPDHRRKTVTDPNIPTANVEAAEQDSCRLVTVVVDGEQIHTRVRGAGEMSGEGRTAFAAIVKVAKRRMEAELAARDPADYPLDVVFDDDLIHKARRMGMTGTRVSTLCGLNSRHVPGRDGGLRCPECVEAERRNAAQFSTTNEG